MSMDFRKIRRVDLTSDVLQQTKALLQRVGRRHDEAFVLWAGFFRSENEFAVTTALFPKQESIRSTLGVGVYIEGREIREINQWLYVNRKVLLGQVHSHPTQAFHSDVDDFLPMVTTVGQFSVVVPYFARGPLPDLSGCAVFRLNGYADWKQLSRSEVDSLFKVI